MITLKEAMESLGLYDKCVAQVFEFHRVVTLSDLENLPSKHGSRLCNHDIYSLISTVGDFIRSGSSSLGDELPVSARQRNALAAAGVKTVDDIREAGVEGLSEIKHIGHSTAEKIMAAVQGDNYG